LCEPPPERVRGDEVGEGANAVDLYDRQQLPIALLERGVAGDVDFLELKRLVLADRLQNAARGRAQVAVGGVEEPDSGD
jgi:hypothetical protein